MAVIAKITTRGQTTVPREVRKVLHVGPGDQIIWETLKDGTVMVRRAQPLDFDDLRALEGTLSEWSGLADEEAYCDL
ncbi:MAG: type II toxin-antitoxin system PrlF family antitoxin [Magnetococcales bacterium]|nr:type II toxin-antitoxin system PrlF family antitoxin [Magnetococcales bacterium]